MAPINVRDNPRGARHWAYLRATHLYAVGPLDPDHDAVMRIGGKAPGGGPHSLRRHCVPCQLPVPATSDRQSAVRAERQREPRIGKMLVPEVFQPAGRRMTPSNVSPVVTKRQSAMSSLRANATIIVLRVPRRLSAVRAPVPLCQCAVLLKPQKAP